MLALTTHWQIETVEPEIEHWQPDCAWLTSRSKLLDRGFEDPSLHGVDVPLGDPPR